MEMLGHVVPRLGGTWQGPGELAARSPGSAQPPLKSIPGERSDQPARRLNKPASPKPQGTGVKCRRTKISFGRSTWQRSEPALQQIYCARRLFV